VALSQASTEPRVVEWAWLGRVPYLRALELQERTRDGVAEGSARETLLLLEHEPVITLGKRASTAHVLASPQELENAGIQVWATSRGGDVTFHGPGQLIGYPIVRLPRGIKAHVAAMAGGIVTLLAELGIASEWRESQPGIWVGRDKICALGVHVHRRVAMHGFALNAAVDLTAFRHIVPCGLSNAGVTSIARLLGRAPALEILAVHAARVLGEAFQVRMVQVPSPASRLQIAIGDL